MQDDPRFNANDISAVSAMKLNALRARVDCIETRVGTLESSAGITPAAPQDGAPAEDPGDLTVYFNNQLI